MKVIFGLLLIAAALHDMFHTLFHPSGRGTMAEFVSYRTWRVWRGIFPARHQALSIAGPLAFVFTVVTWVLLIVVGFALVYHHFLASRFVATQGLNIWEHQSFFDAINVSLGSMMTLSEGLVTNSRWLGLAMELEAVMGFVLLTSSLTWVLSIYPVLEYRRSAAHRLSLLHNAQKSERVGLTSMPERETEQLVAALTVDFTKIRNDLAQFPITYYFHEVEARSSLPGALPLAWDLAVRAVHPESSESIRVAGIMLQGAIHDFLELVGSWFLRVPWEKNDESLLAGYAADHYMQELRSS
ncbi:MAG TPA: hypothetical protein VHV32_00080 [Candidatus Angelobacter sp.]|nr:hypothetical protein [Candidatus Angelobacter sp.]